MTRAARRAATVLVATACLWSALYGLWQLARSRTKQVFGRLVDRVATARPVVALTFDDGPTEAALEAVMAPLAQRGVRATFFVCGAHLEQAPEAGRRLVEAGHQLGNHTFSHARMVLKSPAFVRDELDRTDALIRRAGFDGPIRFRPPYSYKLLVLPWILQRSGRTTVTWDVEPESFPDVRRDPSRLAAHVLDRVRPGSIVLLHPWYAPNEATRAALPAILDGLRERGYRFLTVDELLSLRELQ